MPLETKIKEKEPSVFTDESLKPASEDHPWLRRKYFAG